jgi:hypothetical protein
VVVSEFVEYSASVYEDQYPVQTHMATFELIVAKILEVDGQRDELIQPTLLGVLVTVFGGKHLRGRPKRQFGSAYRCVFDVALQFWSAEVAPIVG